MIFCTLKSGIWYNFYSRRIKELLIIHFVIIFHIFFYHFRFLYFFIILIATSFELLFYCHSSVCVINNMMTRSTKDVPAYPFWGRGGPVFIFYNFVTVHTSLMYAHELFFRTSSKDIKILMSFGSERRQFL